MLAKICARGKSFGGVLRYVMDVGKKATHEKQAEFVCSNCVLEGDYKEVLDQFNDVRKVRDNVERPVWHCALSLKAGESVDNWEDCVREFMDKMGFTDENLWVAYKHNDTDHVHVHIIANRVGLDGKLWQGKYEKYKAVAACQEISKKQGLAIVERTGKKDVKDITSQELNMALRRGELPPRQKLQKLLTAVIPQCSTVVELCEQLTALNVQVHPNLASTGRLNGFAFELDGVSFKGSDLGKKFTWKAIEKAGVSYEQARDAEQLKRYQVQPTAGAAKAEYRNQELSQGTEGLDLGVPGKNGSTKQRIILRVEMDREIELTQNYVNNLGKQSRSLEEKINNYEYNIKKGTEEIAQAVRETRTNGLQVNLAIFLGLFSILLNLFLITTMILHPNYRLILTFFK